MSIAGNLRTMSIPDLLQWLASGNHPGTLVVMRGLVEAGNVKLEIPEPN